MARVEVRYYRTGCVHCTITNHLNLNMSSVLSKIKNLGEHDLSASLEENVFKVDDVSIESVEIFIAILSQNSLLDMVCPVPSLQWHLTQFKAYWR